MTKRTWLYKLVTALFILGLAACGGSGGGGGGGGGGGIPSASNSAITPPPTTPVAITTAGGGTTSATNENIAANSFQASSGAMNNATTASGLVGSVTDNSGTQATGGTLADIVRRHAEKIKDHQSAVNTSAVQVQTQPCSNGGTMTVAFDDANNSATEVFVQCNQGGTVTHGTLSSSNVGVNQNLGPTPGSPYTISVSATFSIDLSVASTSPVSNAVTQGSFNFSAAFSGNMQADGTGGVQPGAPNHIQLSMNGSSLLNSDGTVRELLSNFSLSVDENDTLGKTTISGGYTYASTTINGAVTVSISPQLVVQPVGASHPISGTVTITSSASPGKIVLTVISSPVVGVRVDVFANAADLVATNTANLTWAQVDSL